MPERRRHARRMAEASVKAEQQVALTSLSGTACQPGMAVTADIQTGRRRVMGYLLSPFYHQLEEAGHER